MTKLTPDSAEEYYNQIKRMKKFVSSQKEILDEIFPIRTKEYRNKNNLEIDQQTIDLFNRITYYYYDTDNISRFYNVYDYKLDGVKNSVRWSGYNEPNSYSTR